MIPLEQPHTTPKDAAQALAQHGWPVFPVHPNKQPATPNGHKNATTNTDQINEWWTRNPRHGIGIPTGQRTGLWVLDIDVKNGAQGAHTLRKLQNQIGQLPPTITAISGSGGLHYYYQYDPDRPITNGSASNIRDRIGPGIDTRGEGGYIVAPPSAHNDGTQYHWLEGRTPWAIDLADAPAALYDTLEPAVNPDPGALVIHLPTGLNTQTEPAADTIRWWRDQHDYHDELTRDGWTLHSNKPNGQTWYTRPGKPTRDGHSAVLHNHGDGPLVVFTTELPAMLHNVGKPTADHSGQSIPLFDYLCARDFGGDRSAAARHARELHREHHNEIVPTQTPTPTNNPGTVEIVETGLRQFTDLGTWWDNPQPRKQADLALRTDNQGLLYQDQLNWIHGDSGSGKTWLALYAAVQLIQQGHNVTWVHYEDPTPATIVARLKLLGITRDDLTRFHYYDPLGDPLNTQQIIALTQEYGGVHCFLDSIGEALGATGINEDSDVEITPWIVAGPRAIVNAGIGFTGIDHGTKDGQNKLHASGSKRKRAAITGAGILVEAITAPTTTTNGHLRITCAKDRHGNHQQGATIGLARLDHVNGRIAFTIDPPGEALTPEGQALENHKKLVRAAIRAVQEDPGLTKTQACTLMPSASKKRQFAAIDDAIEQGLIIAKPGTRTAVHLWLPEPLLIQQGDN